MRTATALWAKLRVARAAIALLASHSTQLRPPTAVRIVRLHHAGLSTHDRTLPRARHRWSRPHVCPADATPRYPKHSSSRVCAPRLSQQPGAQDNANGSASGNEWQGAEGPEPPRPDRAHGHYPRDEVPDPRG